MFRFSGFDGLRGWLAWTVVLHHIVLYTGLSHRFPALSFIHPLGDQSVSIFVILSGFVITHLIVKKDEAYGVYLSRRLLRIYPIYAVALTLGIASTFLNLDTFLGSPQQMAFHVADPHRLVLYAESLRAHFAAHLGLHAVLLHGAVPHDLLYESQYMFLAPAWSLSLEWQFYLVAPVVVSAARRKLPSIGLAVLAIALCHAYSRGKFGFFILPSFLPGAALLFAVGIGSRLLLSPSGSRGSPIALLLIAAYYLQQRLPLGPILFWSVFFTLAVRQGRADRPAGLVTATVHSIFHRLFDSPTARRFGNPSYSTYLLHMPVLQTAQYIAVRLLDMAPAPAIAFSAVSTVLVTYVLSQAGYHLVEMPAVVFGKRLGPRAEAAPA